MNKEGETMRFKGDLDGLTTAFCQTYPASSFLQEANSMSPTGIDPTFFRSTREIVVDLAQAVFVEGMSNVQIRIMKLGLGMVG